MASLFQRGFGKLKRIAVRETANFRSPLRAALIGFGEIAPDHLAAYEGSGIARVVAVSDVRPTALAGALDRWPFLRGYRDYRRMLAEMKPDVVSVCTWPQLHAEIVASAAAEGVRGILCEKPMALRLDEVEAIQSACAGRGVKLACGHQYRFHPNFVEAAELVRSGAIGRVDVVRGHIRDSLANNGPHLVDTVRFLLGDVPARRATCQCRRERDLYSRDFPREESATGEVEFEGGVRFEFRSGDLAPTFFAIAIEGTGGTLEVAPDALSVNGVARGAAGPAATLECRRRQFGEFLRWVKGRRPGYIADGEQAARTTELILALYESARLGGPVELPLRNRGDVIRQLYPGRAPGPAAPTTPAPTTPGPGERLAMDGGRRAGTGWFSSAPSLGAPELANLGRVIASRNLSCVDGRMVPALEEAAARHYGSPRAVASTSGTAAVHVALGALNLEPGDEVVTTPMTDMGTIIPILACNCLPIFADVDPATGNLSAETIARRITPRTRAVIVVHLFGRPADLGPICDLLEARGIPLIEDCAQAHDAEYRGRKVGTFGALGCFSFQQSKQITCGDGGITLVNREDLARRAALFVDKGWDRKRGVRSHLFLGMNYRMTELQGAVALAQLRRLPALIHARREAADDLTRRLQAIDGVAPLEAEAETSPSWWMYQFGIDEARLGVDIDDFADALGVEGVRVRRAYLPDPLFEYDVIKNQATYGQSRYPFSAFPYEPPDPEDFPGLREFNRRLLYIPWSHRVRPRHVEAIAASVRKVAALLPGDAAARRSRAHDPEASRT